MTVVAVIAVLAGPHVIECADSADGVTVCLRDKLSGIGLLPGREIATVAPPAQETIPDDVTEDAAVAEIAAVPQLTLLRAEPDGSVVIAGTAAPGGEVTVYVDGEPFGTVTAEPSGDWALIPDVPLPAGTTAITVAEPGGVEASQSFLVTIDPEKVGEPQIVARLPGDTESPPQDAGPVAPAREPVGSEPTAAGGEQGELGQLPGEPMTFEERIVAEIPAPAFSAEAAGQVDIAETAPAGEASEVAQPQIPRPALFTRTIVAEIPPPQAAEPANAAAADDGPDRFPPVAAPPAGLVPSFVTETVAEIPPAAEAGPAPERVEQTSPFLEPEIVAEIPILAGRGQRPLVAAVEPVPLRFEEGVVAEIPRPISGQPADAGAAVVAGLPAPPAQRPAAGPSVPRFIITPEIPGGALPAADDMDVATRESDTTPPGVEMAPAPAAPPTIEAIEIDGDVTFLAGTGEDGTTIRVYVDGSFAGESRVDGGHWLVEVRGMVTKRSQRVRAEVTVSGSDGAIASAEVNVVVDLPEPSAADAEAAEPSSPASDAAAEVAGIVPEVPAIAVAGEAGDRPVTPDLPASGLGEPVHQPGGPGTEVVTDNGAPPPGEAQEGDVADIVPQIVLPPPEAVTGPTGIAPDTGASEGSAMTAESEGERLGREDAILAAEAAPFVVPAVPAEWRDDVVPEISRRLEVAALPDEPAPAAEVSEERESVTAPEITAAPPDPQPAAVDGAASSVDGNVARTDAPPVPHSAETAVAPAVATPPKGPDRKEPLEGLILPTPVAGGPTPEIAEMAALASERVPEASAKQDIPTIRVTPLRDTGAMRFSSGQVIIRRGDTLWDLADRVYGHGYKYETIYRANRDRIRRPSRIYPGQVLRIPLVYDD